MGHVYHGKTTRVHFVAGHINSIPIPACGAFINGAAVRYSKDVDRVSCPNCRRTLVACGCSIEQKYRPPDTSVEDDTLIYSLPAFQRRGVSND